MTGTGRNSYWRQLEDCMNSFKVRQMEHDSCMDEFSSDVANFMPRRGDGDNASSFVARISG